MVLNKASSLNNEYSCYSVLTNDYQHFSYGAVLYAILAGIICNTGVVIN